MPAPTDRDVMVVQDKLAELYATLTPSQQQVLDTILAAGLSFVDEDDTGGFIMAHTQIELEQHMRDRMATLQEDWRRANYSADDGQQGEGRRLRWNLKPLLEWFNRTEPRPA
jgi:hypothetical protein